MRYLLNDSTYVLAEFPTGHTVTITVYKLSDDSVIVNNMAMSEIGTTGVFKYLFNPGVVALTEYVWIATDTFDTKRGKLVFGGYPNTIITDAETIDTVVDAIKAKTDNLPATPAAVGSAMTLTAVYDAAKNAASTTHLQEVEDKEDLLSTAVSNISNTVTTIDNNVDTIDTNVDTINGKVDILDTNVDSLVTATGVIDGNVDDIKTIAQSLNAGSGVITYNYRLYVHGTQTPIADVEVWVSTDLAGTNVIARGYTDQNGLVVFYLDAGTVYLWRAKTGVNFTNPDTEIITA